MIKGGEVLTGSQVLEGICWERRVVLFQEGLQFLHKKTLKSEILNDKKSSSHNNFCKYFLSQYAIFEFWNVEFQQGLPTVTII